ncbi:MAG: vitamin k epoxide reductase family/thioredoxin domain-containing protein, partial [Halothiobacillaceae bacterium]
EYRQAKLVTPAVDESRLTLGKSSAPVHLIDWIDIQCPHCKHFIEAMDGILQSIPPDQLSIESRHYPLDAECNPAMPPERRTGVSCLAAKALICLSDKPNFDAQRHELFKQQKFLTKELIWSTLTSDAKTRESLQTCIDAPETQAKLTADLKLADAHGIEGTPLVVINGRKTSAAPPIVYALILAQGDANAAEFATLPPPQKIVRAEEGGAPHQ